MGVCRIENEPIKGGALIMLELFKKVVGDKKEYKQQMARVEALPKDYQFVFEKIQKYMWSFTAGNGYDILKIQYELIDLFETGAAEGKQVLEITGEDVASFCDELLQNAKTYAENWHEKLNRDIMKKIGKANKSK
jgi:DNA-binding ferritin-like protein (Dps family)